MEIVKALPYPFLRNCAELIFHYTGEIPFHLYLKQEFKKNPSWGSRDRRNYRQFCYLFWRRAEYSDKESIDSIIRWLKQTNETKETLVDDLIINNRGFIEFPTLSKFLNPFSTSIEESFSFSKWILKEPPVWIKVVNIQQLELIKNRLKESNIQIVHDFPKIGALAVASQSNINALEEEGLIIIQDIGSQQSMVLDDKIEETVLTNSSGMSMVWDACCGAGGKSLSLRINYPKLDIQCSDIRQGILDNCVERFNKAGSSVPFVFKHNLANSENRKTKFKVVLADIPCSGSGTWRRNPEEMWFYDSKKWDDMISSQLSMVINAAASVTEGGYLVVCTCSLFARENEELITQFLHIGDQSKDKELGSNNNNNVTQSHNVNNNTKLESEDIAALDLSITSNHDWELLEQKFCGGIEYDGDFIFRSILRRK